MKDHKNITGMVLASFVLYGCMSGSVNKNKSANDAGSIPPIYSYQQKAMEFEKNDEWQSALENWRIADALMSQKISALTEKTGNNAEMHYQKGLNLQRDGLQDKAIKEFFVNRIPFFTMLSSRIKKLELVIAYQ